MPVPEMAALTARSIPVPMLTRSGPEEVQALLGQASGLSISAPSAASGTGRRGRGCCERQYLTDVSLGCSPSPNEFNV
jgi:hypothetical protein